MTSTSASIQVDSILHAGLAMARIWAEWSHKHGFCQCQRLYFIETPCEIRLEEIAEERRLTIWRQWDGIGLGYIGPRISQEVQEKNP